VFLDFKSRIGGLHSDSMERIPECARSPAIKVAVAA
jgi:hypothetical protein